MTDSRSDDLMTIGVLAKASGLTPSALRFYGDCGLLVPATIDEATGYRYYTEDQCPQAVMIRRLRQIGLPLEAIASVLTRDAGVAFDVLDTHVAMLRDQANEAARVIASIKQTMADVATGARTVLPGMILATAVEQVLSAALRLDRSKTCEFPALAGILLEADSVACTLTATDRFRLSTRSMTTLGHTGASLCAVVEADDLGGAAHWLRQQREVAITATAESITLRGTDNTQRRCGVISEQFPDYRMMLSALPFTRTRVIVARGPLQAALEQLGDGPVRCATEDGTLTIAGQGERRLPAVITGTEARLFFDPATLLPAVADAVGPDVMLDISSADRPVVLRSATDGDLTTLVMPVRDPATHR